MSQVHNITPPSAVIPPGNSFSSINRVASMVVAADRHSLPAVSMSQIDPVQTPSETLVRKSDGSSVVQVTISLGAGKTNTYEKPADVGRIARS